MGETLPLRPVPHSLPETQFLHHTVRTPACPQRAQSFRKGRTASSSRSPPPPRPVAPCPPSLRIFPGCLSAWLEGAGGEKRGSSDLGSRGWGRGGSCSVATSSPSNAPIQQRQRRCHLSTEALQWLLFSQTAVPVGGGGVEGGWARWVLGGYAL